MDEIITLSYGSGGKKTSQLIEEIILPPLANKELNLLSDGAILEIQSNKLAFSTDSFVVSPYFFPGGDIGKLAVCGTVNDLSVCGATPMYLSLSFIIEEGFKIDDLKKLLVLLLRQPKSAMLRSLQEIQRLLKKEKVMEYLLIHLVLEL